MFRQKIVRRQKRQGAGGILVMLHHVEGLKRRPPVAESPAKAAGCLSNSHQGAPPEAAGLYGARKDRAACGCRFAARRCVWSNLGGLKQQNRTLDVMEHVVGNGAEQYVSDLTAAFMATDNKELEFLGVGNVGDC